MMEILSFLGDDVSADKGRLLLLVIVSCDFGVLPVGKHLSFIRGVLKLVEFFSA
jgi:hypothetical protein